MLTQRPGRCDGFSMIEVLVTMVIISVGLLGAAALQVKSMQYAYSSYQHTIATVQANDAVERLWANVCALPTKFSDIEEDWKAAWKDDTRLPKWSGDIDDKDSGTYTITIGWYDRFEEEDEEDRQVVITTAIPQLPGCP
ncbi:MAG: type IV pilus modification protein PilV [Comamonas sp.]|nr:type IV pilus modification protein PilV [Comamonas sp.]